MANYTNVEERVESPSERRVRYFLAVMFFLQTICTAIPFIQGSVEVEGETVYRTITAFNMVVNPGGYGNIGSIPLAVIGAILVVFPIVAFFFCVLDSKSKKKFFVSGACAVICASFITTMPARSWRRLTSPPAAKWRLCASRPASGTPSRSLSPAP